MRALRAVGDAARLAGVAKQAEIGEIESHGMTPAFGFNEVRLNIMPIVGGYFNVILSLNAKSSCQQQLCAGAALHCGTTMDWIGTIPKPGARRANSDEHNGRNQGPCC